MPQTQFKGYELQTTGSNSGTWGNVLNDDVISVVDINLGGVVSKTMAASDVTLSATEAQNAMVRLTGTVTANINLISSAQGFYMVENLCSDAGGAVFLTNGVGFVRLPWASRCAVFADIANGVRLFSAAFTTNPTEIPTGTQMLFTSAAVPTGWTLVTSLHDYGLAISTTGAGTAGSVAYSTLFARTTTDGFTLIDCPAHSHVINSIGSSGTSGAAPGTAHWSQRTSVDGQATGTTDNNVGGNQPHTHPLDMRVLSVSTIIGARAT